MMLQAFQLTHFYSKVLNRTGQFQAVIGGWRFFQNNRTLLDIKSIRSQYSHIEPS